MAQALIMLNPLVSSTDTVCSRLERLLETSDLRLDVFGKPICSYSTALNEAHNLACDRRPSSLHSEPPPPRYRGEFVPVVIST